MATRERVVAASAAVQALPDPADVARILADQARPELVVDDGHDPVVVARAAGRDFGLADATDARIGLDAHERRVEGRGAAEVANVLPLRRDRHLQPGRFDTRDLHGVRAAQAEAN